MIEIMEGLRYYSRREWGARTAADGYPRLGYPVNRLDRTELIFHHTVVIDNDATPNLWETLSEVFAKMRQLQTIRPDLGKDVPYNLVIFFMADGTIVVCEGRGLDRTGAHTHGHNTRGIAIAGEGNYELAAALAGYAGLLSRLAGWLKIDMGMENLGSSRPTSGPNVGAIAFGHKDLSTTACPGTNLYKIIPSLTFAVGTPTPEPEPKEEDMVLVLVRGKTIKTVFALDTDGRKYRLRDAKHYHALLALEELGGIRIELHRLEDAELEAIPDEHA